MTSKTTPTQDKLNDPRPWVRNEAKREIEYIRTKREGEDFTIRAGVMRWTSNGSIVPEECAEAAAYIGLPVDTAKHATARDADTRRFLAEYRRNYTGPSREERMEARAAFGPGVELVNAITGKRWTT